MSFTSAMTDVRSHPEIAPFSIASTAHSSFTSLYALQPRNFVVTMTGILYSWVSFLINGRSEYSHSVGTDQAPKDLSTTPLHLPLSTRSSKRPGESHGVISILRILLLKCGEILNGMSVVAFLTQ